jgi:hypothetical protein
LKDGKSEGPKGKRTKPKADYCQKREPPGAEGRDNTGHHPSGAEKPKGEARQARQHWASIKSKLLVEMA